MVTTLAGQRLPPERIRQPRPAQQIRRVCLGPLEHRHRLVHGPGGLFLQFGHIPRAALPTTGENPLQAAADGQPCQPSLLHLGDHPAACALQHHGLRLHGTGPMDSVSQEKRSTQGLWSGAPLCAAALLIKGKAGKRQPLLSHL